MAYASRSADELARLTDLRISCAPMPSTKSSASARQLDALVSAVDRPSDPRNTLPAA